MRRTGRNLQIKCEAVFNIFVLLRNEMRKIFLFLLVLFPFVVCGQQGKSITFSDKTLIYRLDIDSTPEQNYIASITIMSLLDNSVQQVLKFDSASGHDHFVIICSTDTAYKKYCTDFVVEDMNFDGYNDFRIAQAPKPAYGRNISYYYWTYNPKKKLFEEDETLENTFLPDPSFDASSKTISCTMQDPSADPEHDYEEHTYKYRYGNLIEIEQVNVNYSTNKKGKRIVTTTTIRPVNGIKKVVKTQTAPAD